MQKVLLLLTVSAALAGAISLAPRKELEMSNMLKAAIERANMKDLGRCLLNMTYNHLSDKLGLASAESWDCTGYASDALNSLTTAERKAVIERAKYPAFGQMPQELAAIEDEPLKDLGLKLFSTALNFLMDKLNGASVESWNCNDYALNALKSLTKAERTTVIQQAYQYRKAQIQAQAEKQQMGGYAVKEAARKIQQAGGYAGEEAAQEQFMEEFLPVFSGLVSKYLENANQG